MPATPVQVLLLSGPAGVGKSTLGWEIAAQLRRLGLAHVLLDSDEADEQWERTQAQARGFRRHNAGSADVLDTTGRAVPGLARQVIERTGWASQAAQAQDGPAATETSWPARAGDGQPRTRLARGARMEARRNA